MLLYEKKKKTSVLRWWRLWFRFYYNLKTKRFLRCVTVYMSLNLMKLCSLQEIDSVAKVGALLLIGYKQHGHKEGGAASNLNYAHFASDCFRPCNLTVFG